MTTQNLKILRVLNGTLGDWFDRSEAIYKTYKGKNHGLCHGIVMNRISLNDSIEDHKYLLVYRNLVEAFVSAYFFENYLWLTTEKIKSYTGENVLDLPFINEIYSMLNNTTLSVIKEVFHDSVCLSERYLEPYILETWHKVTKEIESENLKLELNISSYDDQTVEYGNR